MTRRVSCRVCGGKVIEIVDFGRMPLANAFIREQDFAKEKFFRLAAGVCEKCSIFQLLEQPQPSAMFHSDYPFFTAGSERMREHFQRLADETKGFLTSRSAVLEIGCNDGTLLENFHRAGFRCFGVDPSSNTLERALARGLFGRACFFNSKTADEIYADQGLFDLVLSANCFCHIPDLGDVLDGVARVLSPQGVLVTEDPYLGEVFRQTSYDQIYDEHVFLFSVTSMANLLAVKDFEIFDLEPQWTHGGSMRFYIARKGARPVSSKVREFLKREEQAGFKREEIYRAFAAACERSRAGLRECLEDFKRKDKPVYGYGATSKSTTVLNYAGIGPDLIKAVFDTTPEKQGKFTPGTHIPILPYAKFIDLCPEAVVLFAWNHAQEILKKEEAFRARGGKWIFYIPEAHVE